jgi:leader peptidase (prepilin peptidase)/N-methyltransferase
MAIIIFILGLIIGSFLNVCIYRIPRHKSIARPRSFCPNCKITIHPYDNIPVLSYLILGGRCRYCKTKISWQYPLVELLTGILFLLLFLKFSLSLQFIAYTILVALLIIATFTDLSHRIIPNVVSIPGIILGLIVNSSNFKNVLFGVLICAAILWIFRQIGLLIKRKEMMGWGDIKLAGMIGAFLGLGNGVLALFLGVCLGVFLWTLLILLKLKTRKEYIPFGAFLSAGSVIAVFYGANIINWYLRLFIF